MSTRQITTKFWLGMAVLIIISPFGLILPEHFKAGSAWGEWSADEMQKLVGYIPQGLEKLSRLWGAPIPDYTFRGWQEKGLGHLGLGYIFSAAIGIGLAAAVIFLLGKLFIRRSG